MTIQARFNRDPIRMADGGAVHNDFSTVESSDPLAFDHLVGLAIADLLEETANDVGLRARLRGRLRGRKVADAILGGEQA